VLKLGPLNLKAQEFFDMFDHENLVLSKAAQQNNKTVENVGKRELFRR
jgi:hypothetical protein